MPAATPAAWALTSGAPVVEEKAGSQKLSSTLCTCTVAVGEVTQPLKAHSQNMERRDTSWFSVVEGIEPRTNSLTEPHLMAT